MLISAGSLISFSIKGKTKAFSFSDDTSRRLVSGVPLPRDRIGATAWGTRDRKRGLSVGAEERLGWQLSGHRGRLLRGHRPHVPRQSLGQLGVRHRIASRGETGLEARGTSFGAKLRLANDVRPGSQGRVGACRAGRGVTRHCSVRTETGRPPPEAWQRDRWETARVTARARPHPRFSGRACSWDAAMLACKSPSVTMLLLVRKRAGPEGGPCQPAEGRSGVRKGGSPLLRPKGMHLFTLRSQVD